MLEQRYACCHKQRQLKVTCIILTTGISTIVIFKQILTLTWHFLDLAIVVRLSDADRPSFLLKIYLCQQTDTEVDDTAAPNA